MTSQAVLPAGLTVVEARRLLAEAFREEDLESPELDARLLTGHVLGLDHTALVAQAGRKLDSRETAALHKLALRRLDRDPVARIIGEADNERGLLDAARSKNLLGNKA